MMLTGKAKEMFEAWYFSLSNSMGLNYGTINLTMNRFYCLPKSMQFGIYQDWADSIGYDLCAFNDTTYDEYDNEVVKVFWAASEAESGYCDTRQEARNAAIEKLNEMINKG